uniref:Copia protein n=1 Tax=Cajanus cajan TaxID=3821 RepID=A0A151RW39_CAJCA|nr:Copia protein [Cajanus cajan]
MHKKRYSKTSNTNIYGPKSIWVPKTKIIFVADLFNKKKKCLFCKRIQNEKGISIASIRSDHGGEFENEQFQYQLPNTSRQKQLIYTSCYIQNKIYLRPILKKTPYELWKGRAPNISYFHPFGCKCFILNTKDNLGKFDSKIDEGILLGYSKRSRAYRVFNNKTKTVEEAIHVKFDENKPDKETSELGTFFENMQVDKNQSKEDESKGNENQQDDKEEREPVNLKLMQDEFEMSMMGELKFFLGLQIVQSDEGIKIHQTKYTKELLKKYKMDDAKSMKTLMHPSKTLGLDEDSLDVDITMYWGMVGLLLYLTASRTEIMFSVCVCARFQVRPKEVYLQAVKRILRYLKGTTNLGISFYRSHNFSLLGYYDADYAWDKWERKSTSGGCHFLGHCLVSWSRIHKSKLQWVSQPEFKSLASLVAKIQYIYNLLLELHIRSKKQPLIWCDNQEAVLLSTNPVLHTKTKHFELDLWFVRERMARGQNQVRHIPVRFQVADLLDESQSSAIFLDLRDKLDKQSTLSLKGDKNDIKSTFY